MTTRTVALLVVALLAAMAPAPARVAQAAEVSDDAMKKARTLYKRGKTHQEAKEYEQAAAAYRAAYELAPAPELLFNLGQVYRLAGNKREALWNYRRFLEAMPNGPGSDEAREHITKMTRQLDEEEEREEGRRKRPPSEATPTPLRSEATDPIIPAPGPGPVRSRDENPGRTLRLAGIVTGAAGAAAIGFGIFKGVQAMQAADTVTYAERWTQEQTDALRSGQDAAKMAYVLYGVGGALILTGGVLYYYGYQARSDAENRASIQIQPILAPKAAGLGLRGSF